MITILRITSTAAALVSLLSHPPALAAEQAAPAPAQAVPPQAPAPASAEEVRALAEELRRLKLELGLRDVEYQQYGSLGPAASKVYFAPKGLSIGGYGEVTYRNTIDAPGDESDLLRAVFYVGYRFSDRIVFNSEIEFEHAGKEVAVEFAYLDFMLARELQLRVGNLLVPMGLVNELHEPPFFNGVFRNEVERNIIPATWNENGLGVHGDVGPLRYQAYLVTGLNVFGASAEEPVAADEWLRRARSGGGESAAQDLGGVVALSAAVGPATLGGSVYRGRAGQGARAATGELIHADVTLAELHGTVAWRGLTGRALFVVGTLSDTALLAQELPGGPVLGSRVQGGYLEAGYDVLTLLAPGGESSLTAFARYEAYDLNASVADGFTPDPAVDRTVTTAGLTYKPITNVVLKADWQRKASAVPGSAADQVNLGAGYAF